MFRQCFGEVGPARLRFSFSAAAPPAERGTAWLEAVADAYGLFAAPLAQLDADALLVARTVNGDRDAPEGDLVIFARAGDDIAVKANTNTQWLLMDGEAFAMPMVAHSPFVMSSRAEIQRAFKDYQPSRMGELVAWGTRCAASE